MLIRCAFVLAACLAASTSAIAQTAAIDLGPRARAEALFSFPNNCDAAVCYIPQTLEQTIHHYLRQSLDRDGYASTKLEVRASDANVIAHLDGPAATAYPDAVHRLLTAGDKALAAARALNAGTGDARQWRYNWRFFLPLGLAMTNHRTVELLHFPPDYSLLEAQDYLRSNTTDRWAELLVVNGVDAKATPSYQAIVDIAPVAAPASDGSNLTGTYDDFQPYAGQMLADWTANPATPGRGLSVVAFGGPVRDWVETYLGKKIGIDEVATATIAGREVPVLGANHPSYIFYAASKNGKPDLEAGMRIMTQDLVAACWQAGMGADPAGDPQATLSGCSTSWAGKPKEVCLLLATSIYKKTPGEAEEMCRAVGTKRSAAR
ncbi:MAG: hypothetical protein AB1918_15810 [Pseudomonadota bacterium]